LAENRPQWCSSESTIINFFSSVWSREYFDYLSYFSLTHMTTSPPRHVLIQLVQQANKNGPYHATMDAGSRCLFIIVAHTSTQCFINTSHTDSFTIYVGYVTMLSASHTTVVPTEVLTLHAIQWLRNVMKLCHSEYPVSWAISEPHTLWIQV
jgi:hypothetical protein